MGIEVAVYNTNDRLVFYNNILVNTHQKDETGHPICTSLDQEQSFTMAMQGLTHACYTFWPDVILFISAFFTTAGMFTLMRQRKHKIAILHTESPYQDDEQMMRGEMADLNLINDPVNLDAWKAMDIPAVYMPHAYRPSMHYPRKGPVNPKLNADLSFIGTAFKSRVEFMTAMNLEGLDVLLGGSDWAQQLPEGHPLRKYLAHDEDTCVDNDVTAEVYRNAKCGINMYRREGEKTHASDKPYAMGPREVEMAACGLFYLRDSRPEGDQVLSMLPTFATPEDASEQLRWWLAHDTERENAASLAREAIADRTFENNAKRLLRLLKM